MMALDDIRNIGVAGAGTMGAGIAQVAALSGFDVILFDVNDEQLVKAEKNIQKALNKGIEREKITEQDKAQAISKIRFTSKLEEVVADVIIEAIIERLEVKVVLFSKLAEFNSPDTILATNTSSFPITQIAEQLPNPRRVVGMHFFNPAHIMKLVEVISGEKTSPEVAQVVKVLAENMGKVAAMVKDSPGFIVNRVARHFYVESLKVLEDSVADHTTIDSLMENAGFRMGPFKLMDLIGVDTNLSVTKSIYEAFDRPDKFKPSVTQQKLVDEGRHGKKTGMGFYDYN